LSVQRTHWTCVGSQTGVGFVHGVAIDQVPFMSQVWRVLPLHLVACGEQEPAHIAAVGDGTHTFGQVVCAGLGQLPFEQLTALIKVLVFAQLA
jgi:hypothetical protein